MKKIFLFAAVLAGASLASCSSEEELDVLSTETLPTELVASNATEDFSSRVGFEETTGKFYWTKGDRIGLLTEPDADGKHTCAPYGLTANGIGKAQGTFVFNGKGAWTGGKSLGYAVYPHSFYSKLGTLKTGEKRLEYILPDTLVYDKVDTSFFTEKQGEGNSFNALMFGKVDGNKTIFKHIGGVFCVKVDKMPATEGILTFRANGKKISGLYKERFDPKDPTALPLLEADKPAKDTKEDVVIIKFKNAIKDQPGVFYISVPTGKYEATGFSVRVKIDPDHKPSTEVTPIFDCKLTNAYTINRGSLQVIEATNAL